MNNHSWYAVLGRNTVKDTTEVANLLQSYAQTRELNKGKQLHAQLIRGAYPLCTFLTNHFISMYSRNGELGYAFKLFDKMPQRNVVSWTVMITGFSQNRRFREALNTFCLMRSAGEALTQFAFSSVLRACASLESIELGTQMHSLAMKCGFSNELFVGSNLADMYSKCGIMYDACKVFNEMPRKDKVLWTSLIDGHVKNGDCEEALIAYKKVICDDILIDPHVLCSTLSACSSLKSSNIGKSLHSTILKLGFELDTILINALIDMYSKSQDMESASKIFQADSHCRNIVSYTALIDGYVEMGHIENAPSAFVDLRRQGVGSNEFTFSTLKACANQAALEHGVQLHGQVVKSNFDRDPCVASTLVDMYGKCGLFITQSKCLRRSRTQRI